MIISHTLIKLLVKLLLNLELGKEVFSKVNQEKFSQITIFCYLYFWINEKEK